MKCQRCQANEARHHVYTDLMNVNVCVSCAMEALKLGIAVKIHPKLRTDHQTGDTKESLDPYGV